MEVEVNFLAVFLAALSSMAVGAVWYSPASFFKSVESTRSHQT